MYNKLTSSRLIWGGESGCPERIVGFDYLKVLMSYAVVTCHYWESNQEIAYHVVFDSIRGCCIATFVMLSFFLTGNAIENGGFEVLFKRIVRLFKPYLVWPIIAIIFYDSLSYIKDRMFTFTFRDLGYQILFGSTRIEGVMYYNWDLMVIILFLWTVFHYFGKHTGWVIVIGLMLADIGWIISEGNYNSFVNMPWEMKWTLGRLFEFYPYAVVGMVLKKLLEKITSTVMQEEKYRNFFRYIFLIMIFELAWMLTYYHDVDSAFAWKGFGDGHTMQMLTSTAFITVSYFIPYSSGRISSIIHRIIGMVSRYTMGIYCLHNIVGTICVYIALRMYPAIVNSLLMCFIIFLLSYIMSFVIAKLPFRFVKQIVC